MISFNKGFDKERYDKNVADIEQNLKPMIPFFKRWGKKNKQYIRDLAETLTSISMFGSVASKEAIAWLHEEAKEGNFRANEIIKELRHNRTKGNKSVNLRANEIVIQFDENGKAVASSKPRKKVTKVTPVAERLKQTIQETQQGGQV